MSSQNDLITIMTVQKWAIKQNLFLVVIGYNLFVKCMLVV
jgi:hypothetical protein